MKRPMLCISDSTKFSIAQIATFTVRSQGHSIRIPEEHLTHRAVDTVVSDVVPSPAVASP